LLFLNQFLLQGLVRSVAEGAEKKKRKSSETESERAYLEEENGSGSVMLVKLR